MKPNPARQAILVGLALLGIGIGYGMGFLFKKEPPAPIVQSTDSPPVPAKEPVQKKPQSEDMASPEPQTDEHNQQTPDPGTKAVAPENIKPKAYEEPLPEPIVDFPIATVPPRMEGAPTTDDTSQGGEPEKTRDEAAATTPISEPEPETGPQTMETALVDPEAVHSPEPLLVEPSKPSFQLGEGWLQNALEVDWTDKPKIAIVIDDMGVDAIRSRLVTQLKGPLTMSYLTYARNLEDQSRAARDAGHELMLHIPMEPTSPDIDPGPNVLLSQVPEEETRAALTWGLDQFSGYVGVNNHMGSKFTSNLEGMKTLMQELKRRKLFFLDSVTSGATKGQITAHQFGVPFLARNIFLDHIDDLDEINSRLEDVKRLAMRKGYAVAIGHPRDRTITALKPWLETIENEGFQLVPVSALIRHQYERLLTARETTTEKEN